MYSAFDCPPTACLITEETNLLIAERRKMLVSTFPSDITLLMCLCAFLSRVVLRQSYNIILTYMGLKPLQPIQVYVATADLDTTLRRLTTVTTSARPLIVTDIGRTDLILGLTSANESSVGPHVTGILCTNSEYGRRDMSPHVHAILQVCPFLLKNFSFTGLVAELMKDRTQ